MVTNEEYNREWTNINNYLLMLSITNKYKKLTEDDAIECMQMALWRAMQKFVEGGGEKLTTRLVRHTHWECKRKLRRRNDELVRYMPKLPEVPVKTKDRADDISHVYECMDRLPEVDREIISRRYLYSMTLEEIGAEYSSTRQAAFFNVNSAIRRLQGLCGG